MPDNSTNALVKSNQSLALARVSNQLTLTEKLLNKPEEPFLIPYRKGNKWGFCDRNRNIVIDCIYDWVSIFKDDIAIVELKAKWGFINKLGKKITPIKFDGIKLFNEGLFRIKQNESWIIGDILNNKIISLKYNFISDLYGNFATVSSHKNKFGAINKKGEEIIETKYDFIDPFQVDSLPIDPFKPSSHFEFKFDYELVEAICGKKGILDKMGNIIIPFSHTGIIQILTKNLVALPINGNNQYQIYNITNQQLSPYKYDCIYGYIEGLCLVRCGNKYGFIDENNNEIVPLIYDLANCYSEGIASVCNQGRWGIINKEGKHIISLKYDCLGSCHEGLIPVMVNEKWGFININEEIVIPITYDYVESFFEGLASVSLKNKWGLINRENNTILDFLYSSIDNFINDVTKLELNDKTGFYNKKHKTIIEPKYENNMSNLVTHSFEKYPNHLRYQYYLDQDLYYKFRNNLCLIEISNRFGYIDHKGTEYWED